MHCTNSVQEKLVHTMYVHHYNANLQALRSSLFSFSSRPLKKCAAPPPPSLGPLKSAKLLSSSFFFSGPLEKCAAPSPSPSLGLLKSAQLLLLLLL